MIADRVRWGSTAIPYRYRFSRTKTLAISVWPSLAVEVTAPKGTSVERIRAKVSKRGAWILRAWREFERFHPLQPPRKFVPGETHRYLGRQYRLRAFAGPVEAVALRRGCLEVTVPRRPTASTLTRIANAWYADRAEEVLRERLTACHRLAAIEGVPLPKLAIRRMVRRWGSCTPTGRVILNPELVQAPKECIDYVIMHELCHLAERNHSPRFWRLLGRLMPDWEDRRERLNRMAGG
jgi:predicted metal-dependent hydrolase